MDSWTSVRGLRCSSHCRQTREQASFRVLHVAERHKDRSKCALSKPLRVAYCNIGSSVAIESGYGRRTGTSIGHRILNKKNTAVGDMPSTIFSKTWHTTSRYYELFKCSRHCMGAGIAKYLVGNIINKWVNLRDIITSLIATTHSSQ